VSGEPIRSDRMVHVVVEHFGPDLDGAILRSHLLAALAFEQLVEAGGASLERRGNDLYWDERKLSVCVATVTPVSIKMHFGVNVTCGGAPVPAAGLADLGIDPETFARGLLDAYAAAMQGVAKNRSKVRGVP
ncbi:MAG: DUF366 family protein, partial [Planctomycetota bacterium]